MFKRFAHLRVFTLLVGLLLASACTAQSSTAPYTEGNEYVTLPAPQQRLSSEGKVEVVEVFSYGCIHCAQFAPVAEKLRKQLPAGVAFKLLPAPFSAEWLPFARAYYAAGRYTDARAALAVVLAAQPANTQADAWLGLTYEGLEQFDSARATYTRVLARQPDDNVARLLRGRLQLLTRKELLAAARQTIARESVLAALPPHAWVVNVGRGAVVDEAALIDALTRERIAGAHLDVFAVEPLPADHPFWALPNVVLTPHISGRLERWDVFADLVLDNLGRMNESRALGNVVDRARGY